MKPTKSAITAGLACLTLLAAPALAAGHDTAMPATGAAKAAAKAKPRIHGYMALFTKADANGDGLLSPDEIRAYRKAIFESRDSNGDGRLTKEELVAAAMKRVEQRITRRVDARMARRDRNGDGAIDMNEAVGTRGIDRLFKRFDANGDGRLSAAEMMRAASTGSKAPRAARPAQVKQPVTPSGN